jgi:hypothetical protein
VKEAQTIDGDFLRGESIAENEKSLLPIHFASISISGLLGKQHIKFLIFYISLRLGPVLAKPHPCILISFTLKNLFTWEFLSMLIGLHGLTTSKEWGQRFKRPLMFSGIWVAMEVDLTQPPV